MLQGVGLSSAERPEFAQLVETSSLVAIVLLTNL